MTNFDFLLSDSQFVSFGEVAVSAKKIYAIDPAACVLNCRRGMESEQRRRLSGRAMGYAV
ncbi:hypothetical protein [Pseudoflavonifractor phocaeensis]|uniref:hypothetical protein n=1 Tax=Pseudoflavonifractor phocaeensis TaxID=1870988 RepID=UPI00195D5451|nr:hypothetical protein [Pseudoflavonifractor phocaeensis]MBM6724785.1 hypothetical protein [Pseudoflavonifractor phocaeensis]